MPARQRSIRFRGASPPCTVGKWSGFDEDFTVAAIKLWDGREWLWHDIPIRSARNRHRLGTIQSPMLVANRQCHLSVPVAMKPKSLPDADRVCAVDIGINTLATASIVSSHGTVVARKFFHPAADIDRRNRRGTRIRGKTASLSKGFCRGLYHKARHINEQIAQVTSRQLVDFALEHGANVIVLENLKGWRPKAGAKRSSLRQRFHGWLHRRLADRLEAKLAEAGGRVVYVYARGTSSWAFDGSGKLKRDPKQYELATFTTGKRYHCDLNASYNIAARYWASKLQLTRRKDGQLSEDGNSPGKPRIPVTKIAREALGFSRGEG